MRFLATSLSATAAVPLLLQLRHIGEDAVELTVCNWEMPPKEKKFTTKKPVAAKKPAASDKDGTRGEGSHIADCGTESSMCGICKQPIKDGKDQAIFCEGACKQWSHRYCVGVPLSWFETLTMSQSPFQCYFCCQAKHAEAIESLKLEVTTLRAR